MKKNPEEIRRGIEIIKEKPKSNRIVEIRSMNGNIRENGTFDSGKMQSRTNF